MYIEDKYFLYTFQLNLRFLGEIETDNINVSNSEIISFEFTVSKKKNFSEILSLSC